MIVDPNKYDAYFKNGLIPLLEYIDGSGYKKSVFAFELFNEPEWMVVGGSAVSTTVPLAAV